MGQRSVIEKLRTLFFKYTLGKLIFAIKRQNSIIGKSHTLELYKSVFRSLLCPFLAIKSLAKIPFCDTVGEL